MQQKEGGSNKKTDLPIIQKWFEPNEHYRNCILSRRANGVRARLFAFFPPRRSPFLGSPGAFVPFLVLRKTIFLSFGLARDGFFWWMFLFQYLGNEFLAVSGPLL